MTARTPSPLGDSDKEDALSAEARAIAARLSGRAIAPGFVTGTVQATEFIALALIGSFLLALASRSAPLGWSEILAVIGAPFVAVIAIRARGGYRVTALADPVATLTRVLFGWGAVVIGVAAASFFLAPTETPLRGTLGLFLVAGFLFLIAERAIIATIVRALIRQGRLERRAVIIGGGAEAEALVQAIAAEPKGGIRVCGLFDDRGGARSPDEMLGYPKLGTVADLVAFARLAGIDLLIVSLPVNAEARLLEVLKALWVLPADIRLSALGSRLRFRPRAYSYIGSIPFLDLADQPITGWNALAKRIFDVVFATIGLVVLSPLLLLTAILIKIDSPGPVLFRQKRYGFNNEVIEVLKFRSIYEHLSDPGAKVAVTRGDPRVTRIGRFIRRSSIDELPQLVNVLRGELSLVGPRPHAVNAHTDDAPWDDVVDGYFARHKVKPGMTGWAQINGWRGEVDVPEKIRRRVEYDLEYIDRWSIAFDLYILLMTPLRLVRTENAY
ncbi:undecaprenyl-phosphate glucose phosphotransferase [Kaistia dalseonensis]|uniref:Undecaprenyl-phosphate glucose phosphotransferase n=1 Tax=Kaistia dalseonensis TaxID=410840 RepID=A0ABU0H1L1_9HYPH|nr:undecaprenyl-phosphate glucose phosphotransferase [Kaistia dalseonensis]MCX5493639.1 undecaprenyl-phosphate glucose phosphotransferase [Kaistia dalseonensis]MDQ0436201.1 Undecaprenyl-phosphate glucose phosphotransferase [Kaistia dalseonensis]